MVRMANVLSVCFFRVDRTVNRMLKGVLGSCYLKIVSERVATQMDLIRFVDSLFTDKMVPKHYL